MPHLIISAITNAPIHSFSEFFLVFAMEVGEEACRTWRVETKGSMVRKRDCPCAQWASTSCIT